MVVLNDQLQTTSYILYMLAEVCELLIVIQSHLHGNIVPGYVSVQHPSKQKRVFNQIGGVDIFLHIFFFLADFHSYSYRVPRSLRFLVWNDVIHRWPPSHVGQIDVQSIYYMLNHYEDAYTFQNGWMTFEAENPSLTFYDPLLLGNVIIYGHQVQPAMWRW